MRGGRQLLATLVGMVLISSGTYVVLNRLSSRAGPAPPPTAAAPMFTLPGTIYLAQQGAIYSVNRGAISKLPLSTATYFSQPAVTRDGSQLVVSAGDTRATDLYLLSPQGVLGRRLTDNRATEVNRNHWAFYPRFSADGSTVFYSWDPKDPGTLRDDLAIYSLDVGRSQAPPGMAWTEPDPFTGGDTAPQPLPTGGVLYGGYAPGPNLQILSRVWLQSNPGSPGTALTEPAANCGKPALSPAGDMIAMICSPSLDKAQLVIAPFTRGGIGPALITVDDQLAASPAWAPDGKSVAYLAAGRAGTGFDLWWLPLTPPAATSPKPTSKPSSGPSPTAATQPLVPFEGRRQVTTGLDLDASSAPAWSPS